MYLEQNQLLHELQMLAEPERAAQQVAQQATVWRDLLMPDDPQYTYWDRMKLEDQWKLKPLQHDLSLIANFVIRQGKPG